MRTFQVWMNHYDFSKAKGCPTKPENQSERKVTFRFFKRQRGIAILLLICRLIESETVETVSKIAGRQVLETWKKQIMNDCLAAGLVFGFLPSHLRLSPSELEKFSMEKLLRSKLHQNLVQGVTKVLQKFERPGRVALERKNRPGSLLTLTITYILTTII